MDRNSPIGVFDSGIGGLTVAREIMRQMPKERMVYFGDTARVPYGNKSQETVIRFSKQIIRFLRTQDVKAIVIACNTATACALETVEKNLDIPIIGVVHAGAKAAVDATQNGKIGIIGTEATIRSGIYTEIMYEMNPAIEVTGKPCPLFVPLVEEGLLHDSVTDEIASRYLTSLKGKYIDTLVMGCTHYPLLQSTLKRVMGDDVSLINPAYETALELKALLEKKELTCFPENRKGEQYQFFVSDMAEKFTDFATSILPHDVKETRKINIEEY